MTLSYYSLKVFILLVAICRRKTIHLIKGLFLYYSDSLIHLQRNTNISRCNAALLSMVLTESSYFILRFLGIESLNTRSRLNLYFSSNLPDWHLLCFTFYSLRYRMCFVFHNMLMLILCPPRNNKLDKFSAPTYLNEIKLVSLKCHQDCRFRFKYLRKKKGPPINLTEDQCNKADGEA